MKTILLASVAALSVAAPAYANDFTGFRVEGHAGLDVTSSKLSYVDIEYDEEGSFRYSKTGILYGIGAGYDYAVTPKIIVGAEVNLDFSTASDVPFSAFLNEEFHSDFLNPRREIELSARAGYTLNASTLVYAKVGYVNGGFKAHGHVHTEGSDDYSDATKSKKRDGLRLGVGAETLLGDGMYAKIEYRYTDYKDANWADEYGSESWQLQRHQVLAGLGIRF